MNNKNNKQGIDNILINDKLFKKNKPNFIKINPI
jgi:hypothetical protein